ncbi:MAG: SAM-dependent methyltransferase, partial [Pseudomonadota bacterium]|nr:SAM-dependent methyltransferase [Pseudomonadota bacterium]
VGAGPGDPGLLSLLGCYAIGAADDVVYDALVSEDILALAGANTKLHYAGKRGGRPSAKQADISEKLISLARTGRKVLRLKGGDPFIFGRGGEEALALAAAGVPFRLVPGITAAVAATHRGARNYLTKPASATDILQALEADPANPSLPLPATPPSLQRLEWEHIQRTLDAHDGNISRAADALGIHRRTLQRRLKKRPSPSAYERDKGGE